MWLATGEMLPSGGPRTVHRLYCILIRSSCLNTLIWPDDPDLFFQDGNPFGPFWDYAGVDFDKSVLFGGISFSAYHQPQWMKKWVHVGAGIHRIIKGDIKH